VWDSSGRPPDKPVTIGAHNNYGHNRATKRERTVKPEAEPEPFVDLLKIPAKVVTDIDYGFTWSSPASELIRYFDLERDRPEDLIDEGHYFDYAESIPPAIASLMTQDINVSVDKDHDPTRFVNPVTTLPDYKQIRKKLLDNSSGVVFLHCCTEADVRAALANEKVTEVYYTGWDEDTKQMVYYQLFSTKPCHFVPDLLQFRGEIDEIHTFYVISQFCGTRPILESVFEVMSRMLKPNGRITTIKPMPDRDNPRSELRNLTYVQGQAVYPKMINIDSHEQSWEDYDIPLKDLHEASKKYELKLRHYSRNDLNSEKLAFRSCVVLEFVHQNRVEQETVNYTSVKTVGDNNNVQSTPTIELNKNSTTYSPVVLTVEDNDLKALINQIFDDANYDHCSGRPLEHADLSHCVRTRLYYAPKIDGINAIIIPLRSRSFIMLRNRTDIFELVPPLPISRPINIEVISEIVDRQVIDFIAFDMDIDGSLLRRMDILGALGKRYGFKTQHFEPLAGLIQEYKDPAFKEGVVVCDAVMQYQEVDWIGDDYVISPCRFVKKVPTCDISPALVDWTKESNAKFKLDQDLHGPPPLYEVDGAGNIIRPRTDKTRQSHDATIARVFEGKDYVAWSVLLTISEELLKVSIRAQDFDGVSEPSPEYDMSTLMPGCTEISQIVNTPENMEKLVATYPHAIRWDAATDTDYADLFILRHAKFWTLPATLPMLKFLADKCLQISRYNVSTLKKRNDRRLWGRHYSQEVFERDPDEYENWFSRKVREGLREVKQRKVASDAKATQEEDVGD